LAAEVACIASDVESKVIESSVPWKDTRAQNTGGGAGMSTPQLEFVFPEE
jgi:hypothetical protein